VFRFGEEKTMREPFSVFECSIARRATGRVCTNLRELLEAVRTMPDAVLEHHTIRCALEDHFELHEFPNDLARWCWSTLGDNVLGEQLGLIDPYILISTAALRETIVNLIEERLWHLERVPWCRTGYELYLVESRLIAFDTGERIATPMELLDAIERMTVRSLFYHMHEARRRNAGRTDDFSLWLETCEADPAIIARIRAIDFYFLNLKQLRRELAAAFRQHAAEPQPLGVSNL
jgi:hypothetical protein